MFQSVSKQVLPDQIFEQIRDQILLEHLKAGDPLPSERTLCKQFEVNRGAVREALKKLQQLGLIHIQQGGKTLVLDFYQTASINLLPDLLFVQNQINPRVVEAVLELRIALGQDVARLCALRMEPSALQHLRSLVHDMEESNHLEEQEALSSQIWQALVMGADNIAYQLAFNTLAHTFKLMRTALHDLLAQEWQASSSFKHLVEALELQQEQTAQECVRALLTSPDQARSFLASLSP